MVTDNYVIKIADFGLARDVGQDSQYIKTSNVSIVLLRAKLWMFKYLTPHYFCSISIIYKQRMNKHFLNLLQTSVHSMHDCNEAIA